MKIILKASYHWYEISFYWSLLRAQYNVHDVFFHWQWAIVSELFFWCIRHRHHLIEKKVELYYSRMLILCIIECVRIEESDTKRERESCKKNPRQKAWPISTKWKSIKRTYGKISNISRNVKGMKWINEIKWDSGEESSLRTNTVNRWKENCK